MLSMPPMVAPGAGSSYNVTMRMSGVQEVKCQNTDRKEERDSCRGRDESDLIAWTIHGELPFFLSSSLRSIHRSPGWQTTSESASVYSPIQVS